VDVVLHPPVVVLGHLLQRADGHGRQEEGEAEAEAVLGQWALATGELRSPPPPPSTMVRLVRMLPGP
jgi:hypothetical protein